MNRTLRKDRRKTLNGNHAIVDNKKFFQTLVTLIIPITLQNLISSSLNMVDNLMIGELGESAIAATGLVNQYFFVLTLTLAGINAGASIFISQFWGRKDIDNIRKFFGLDLLLCVVTGILFSIPAFLFPEAILRIFVSNKEVIHLGAAYLRIVGISFTLTAITQAYSAVLRSVGIAGPPMYGSLIGIVVNASLNWILIFGKLGFPSLGVVGAAIATTIARTVEMVFVLVSSYKITDIFPKRPKEFFEFNNSLVKTYFKTSLAVILNEVTWSLGISAYSVIYGKIGIKEVASMQISTTINNMFMVLSIGIATSAAIIIGNQIGAGEEDLAMAYSKKLAILAPLVGIISGLLLYITRPFIVGIFNIDKETVVMTMNVLKIMAIVAPVRFLNVLLIVGVFRGGGDTLFAMILQLSTLWIFAIPAGYIAATRFNWGLEEVFILMAGEELLKIVFGSYRFKSERWLKNVVGEI